jgi:hypothetical protein
VKHSDSGTGRRRRASLRHASRSLSGRQLSWSRPGRLPAPRRRRVRAWQPPRVVARESEPERARESEPEPEPELPPEAERVLEQQAPGQVQLQVAWLAVEAQASRHEVARA